ncbi:phosphoglycerate kinase [Bryobacter aggregatus]|uniref:phosphoglycerate kinase n=1 Tax=Bryobacter aggregatus TaxID=360054 RepID=UPI0004E176B0|nr:phosphoglycerate kinase [Bryobacter aggregatus]
MAKLSIRDLDLKGKTVFIRVDFNVPLTNGGKEITSDKRIRASVPTIEYALEQGAAVVLASHLGRPKGKPNAEMSLAPIAVRLSEILKKPVEMAKDCIGVTKPAPGSVLLLENLRFHAEEEANDAAFSKQLAEGIDVYINDAFGAAHRAHASTVGIIQFVPQAAAGLLMDKELDYLTRVTANPEHPSVAIIGGAKVSDKIEVIQNLLKVTDKLLIGGAMAYTFLKSQGLPIGKSLVEEDKLDLAKELLATSGDKLMLPVDHAVSPEFKADAGYATVDQIPDGQMALDIGPKTIEAYVATISAARTIIWNGPMGVFEMPPFDKGTMAVANAVAEATDKGAISVVGGGDSEKAVKTAGISDRVSHVSTGGGASLEFLSGLELPGVAALSGK